MTTLVIETRVTGSADREDRETMIDVITKRNERQAALDPPGEVLPYSTVPEMRASYAICMTEVAIDVHRHNMSQAVEFTLKIMRDAWPTLSEAQRDQIAAIVKP